MTRLPSPMSSASRRYDPSAMTKSALRNSKNVSVTFAPKSTKPRNNAAVKTTPYSPGSQGIKSSSEANLTSQIVESRWNERAFGDEHDLDVEHRRERRQVARREQRRQRHRRQLFGVDRPPERDDQAGWWSHWLSRLTKPGIRLAASRSSAVVERSISSRAG